MQGAVPSSWHVHRMAGGTRQRKALVCLKAAVKGEPQGLCEGLCRVCGAGRAHSVRVWEGHGLRVAVATWLVQLAVRVLRLLGP